MTIPVPTFTTGGIVLPTEDAIKSALWADFQAAFGGRLNQSDATPQGQLVTSLTAALGASNDLLAQYVNLVDPARSSGRMQDAIGRLYFLERIAATPTTVICTCAGASGTVLPQGSLAQASDGTIYYSTGAATIPSSGSVPVTFAALNTGPITCPAGSLNRIYRTVTGWDSITNAADGTLGRLEETAPEFEARRQASVALNAAGILPAIKAAVLNVLNVTDVYVTENSTGSALTIGGVSVAARSIYVAVQGGLDSDIAAAIWSRKPPGCGMVGSTSVTVTDKTGYVAPYPSYTVKFQRPAAVPVYVAVTLADNGTVPADAVTQVQDAIIAAFDPTIGGTVYALQFAQAIAALGAWVQLTSIAIGTTSSPTASSAAFNINQIASIARANISVALA
ncbi:hypothetical protein AQZ52_10885 [Novosphingobium fuchskuhlense]|uniref:Baseplate protein J-like barrel domain-containing protein n=1 Tax=Novosphingobium fuchskuhlense TaxID=1117702 RepID=A0A117UUP4_9SPHN|nr:baseplate J/gp47 family protein [Novosphingobium fuchskuhlense]KUR71168.1 hypothetical protein AQZ52_10885 [Novosphingobium fuchskuhlense]